MKKHLLLIGLLAAASSSECFAASASWTGTTDGNWNLNTNWNPTTAYPTAGNTATFDSNVANSTVSMNGTAITVGGITFTTNATSYTFNANGGNLTINNGGNALSINANVTGNVTQTFNTKVGFSSASTMTISNNSTTAFLNLAGGVDAGSASHIMTFGGTGNGGRVNGLTQQSGGNASVTFSGTGSGTWEFAGTSNATGLLTISNTAGRALITGDLSTTSSTTLSGWAQINNYLTSGGLSSTSLAQTGTLEAYGADRTINTGTHSIATGATFAGSYSLTISSLVTISGTTSSFTNNISGDKSLIFNNTNFYLADTENTRTRTISGTGVTEIQSNITNNAVGNTVASGIDKQGTGKLVLSGTNTFTGVTKITGGVVQYNSAGAMSTSEIQLNGGVIGLGAGNFTRSLGSSGTNDFRWLTTAGAGGGFAAYGADRTVNIGGAGATFTWDASTFLQTGQTLIFGSSDSTNKLTYVNGLGLGNATRTIQVNDGVSSTNVDAELSGVVSGASGGINKTGSGTLSLSNNNTYTGATTVSTGTLLINGNQTAANGSVTVASGATLGGNGTLGGATTITGILSPGTGTTIETLNIHNDTTWQGASSNGTATDWKFELGAGNTADLLNITGNFTKDPSLGTNFRFDFLGSTATGTFKLVAWSGTTNFSAGDFSSTGLGGGNTGTFRFNGTQLEFVAVPEPGTWALAGIGILFVALWPRKTKRF